MTDQVGVSEEPPVAPVVPGFRPTSLTLAHRVLLRVAEGAYATLALSGELQRATLSGRDKGLCTELVYGSLRQQLRLDRALAAYAPKGLGKLDVVTIHALRLGAYQLLFLRTPAHAAVSGVVNLLSRLRGKGLAGFANALLRKLATTGEPPLPELSKAVRDHLLTLAGELPEPRDRAADQRGAGDLALAEGRERLGGWTCVAARRDHGGDLRDRHRALGHSRQGSWRAGASTLGRPRARLHPALLPSWRRQDGGLL